VGTRSWFRVHSFTGVITGLVLFVICWSGTWAVLSHELDCLAISELKVEPGPQKADFQRLLAAAQDWDRDARVLLIQSPLHAGTTARALINLPNGSFTWIFLNPYTAEVVASAGVTLQRFFRDFHRRLFLGDPGLYTVSVFSITMLVSMISALIFYKRWWARFFRFKPRSGRVFWSELHKTTGLWSLWFVAVIGITGAWYLFEAARQDFGDGKINYAGNPTVSVHAVPSPTSDPSQPGLSLDVLADRVRELRPGLKIGTISFQPGVVVFTGQAGNVLVRDRANQLHLDRRTADVLYDQRASDLPLYWRWADTADPLHFGNFAGLWSKAVWFIFGLLLSSLILTGTYLHSKRLIQEAGGRARHRWPGTGAAILVSLLVLAASVPFGFHQAREVYGPTVDGVKQLPTLAPGVKAVIIGWVALTLTIIAGWVWMLWRPRTVLISKDRDPERTNDEETESRS